MKTLLLALVAASILPLALLGQTTTNQIVVLRTNLGDIDVLLLPASAPKTVQNFLNYVNKGTYNNTVIHRSVPNFIIQGGGYNTSYGSIPKDASVVNEYSVPNTRGTIAMAKLGGNANSATNEWFFNTVDNTSTLGTSNNGGFTVFGKINSAAGLAVMDKIAAVKVPSGVLPSPFDSMPLQNFTSGSPALANFIIVQSVTLGDSVTPPPPIPVPSITSGGVNTASAFGGAGYATGGTYVEIYGTNLAGDVARSWADEDFRNGRAPTVLEGVSVTVNRQPAYVAFVSKNQINVQVPGGVPIVGTVPVAVTYVGQTSPAVQLAIRPTAPGLLAPASFKVGEKQYVVGLHGNLGTFVANGVAGVPNAPAAPGETIIFYGVGFGGVNPSSIPVGGQVVTQEARISNPLVFKIGGLDASVAFAGLAPGLVGLYQFNVTVPASLGTGDHQLDVMVGTESIPQTLFLPVKAQ